MFANPHSDFQLRYVGILLGATLACGFYFALSSVWIQRHAFNRSELIAEQTARAHAALLTSELQKFRLLPLVLGEYPDVEEVLRQGNRDAIARLNAKLEHLAARTDAAAIYVVRNDGLTMAASNWRTKATFVGQNYRFRSYFAEALRRGDAEMFALGTVSRRPGLYLARRVDGGAGVVVVKIEFDLVEAAWRRTAGTTFVAGKDGLVLITSNPSWRFQESVRYSSAAHTDLKQSNAYGRILNTAQSLITGTSGQLEALGTTSVALGDGRLIHLEPIKPQLVSVEARFRLFNIVIAVSLILVLALVMRARDRRRGRDEARRQLEDAVKARTHELNEASDARALLDSRFRQAREELAHANRLATLGQVTAGVAHELNQPIATIRVYAENAILFLGRGQLVKVSENLERIIGLSQRMGTITTDLRSFVKRRKPQAEKVALGIVIDGVSLILADQLSKVRLQICLDSNILTTEVKGERIALEQVLINILQNALDALALTDEPYIKISGMKDQGSLKLIIADNGPGISPEVRSTIFDPFVTDKPQGLGLGLAIAANIASEISGSLSIDETWLNGASFIFGMKVAER